MNISQLIKQLGGESALDSVGHATGLDRDQVASMIDSVAPMVLRGIQHQASSDDGLSSFRDALKTGNHGRYIDEPSVLRTEEAKQDGLDILGHVFGDHKVNRNVASEAANRTGIDTSLIEKALPMVAGLIMAAMSKHSNQGHALDTSAEKSNALGPLASLFDMDHDGQVLDDIIGMASRI